MLCYLMIIWYFCNINFYVLLLYRGVCILIFNLLYRFGRIGKVCIIQIRVIPSALVVRHMRFLKQNHMPKGLSVVDCSMQHTMKRTSRRCINI